MRYDPNQWVLDKTTDVLSHWSPDGTKTVIADPSNGGKIPISVEMRKTLRFIVKACQMYGMLRVRLQALSDHLPLASAIRDAQTLVEKLNKEDEQGG